MNRKKLRKMQQALETRGGKVWINPEIPPQLMGKTLEALLECPDCRAAILEQCNSEDRKNVNIDETLAMLAMSSDH
jgi:hypothetical protein